MWVELSLGLRPIKIHSSNYKMRNNECVLGVLGTGVKDPQYYPKRFCMGVKDPNECKRPAVLSEKVLHGCERPAVVSEKFRMGVRDPRWNLKSSVA